MARYRELDVFAFLTEHGCEFDGDTYRIGMGWFAPDGLPFTTPSPEDGYFDAEVIDQIMADRWIWRGPNTMTRYP